MIENITKIMGKRLCDHCLGRAYSQLLSGYSNDQRGRAIRNFMAMLIDSKGVDYSKIDMSNFYGITFRQIKLEGLEKERCWLCDEIFDGIDSMVAKAKAELRGLEFKNFLVGTRVPDDILEREEKIWEDAGIEYVESIKSELNREVGKRLGMILNKESNFKNPQIVVLADFANKSIDLEINSLYVFGRYQKLIRGIPQCKWGTPGRYKSSIQEIVAKPFMKAAKGGGNAFHGMGREDVDARCLGWRPFVIEVTEPTIRKINLSQMKREINKTKKVKVKDLRFCERFTVVKVKTERGDKTYRVDVEFDKPIDKKDLAKINSLKGTISQQTPTRVMHRRADLTRKRTVKEIRYKIISKRKIEIIVKTNAGLYVKELVSGDNGRTKPSVAEILNVKATPKNLDVVCVDSPKNL